MHSHLVARLAALTSLPAALLWVAVAPAGASTGQVPKSVVETQAAKVLAAETGQKLPKVTCPGGLNAKVGASIKCTLTASGSSVKYPVKVTVNSVRNSNAYFTVQVGQAPGAANKTKFCNDNAILDKATSVAQTPADLIPIFKANANTLIDFQATAPPKIVDDVGTLVHAARVAVTTGNARSFATAALTKAGQRVDAFCGQNADGSPIGSASTTTAP
jgi:hypothetical protein